MSIDTAGKYFGTEINEKWWRRYAKEKMLARGNGTFSYNEQSISFLRRLTQNPINISFKDIEEFKIGKWHAGQWGAGRQIIKVLWKKGNQTLSSGFSVDKKPAEMQEMLSELNDILKQSKPDAL